MNNLCSFCSSLFWFFSCCLSWSKSLITCVNDCSKPCTLSCNYTNRCYYCHDHDIIHIPVWPVSYVDELVQLSLEQVFPLAPAISLVMLLLPWLLTSLTFSAFNCLFSINITSFNYTHTHTNCYYKLYFYTFLSLSASSVCNSNASLICMFFRYISFVWLSRLLLITD